jgi:signal recognition particle GTPase
LQEVNRLITQFEQTRKVMKAATSMKNPMQMMRQVRQMRQMRH